MAELEVIFAVGLGLFVFLFMGAAISDILAQKRHQRHMEED